MLLTCIFLIISLVSNQELLDNSLCNHLPERGHCTNYEVQWYYDRYDHRCRRFFYGGCGGNGNRFKTLKDCNRSCHFSQSTAHDRCFQPHDPGQCQSDIERWYFDKDKKQCVCSWWSGCGGNSNLYYSYNHCMLICGEFVENGPGIDEKYWDKINSSQSDTRAVLTNPVSGYFNQRTNDNTFQTAQPSNVENNRRLKIVSDFDKPLNMGSKTDQELYINSKSTMSTTTSISGWNGHILPEQDSISRTTDASQQHRAYGIVHIAHIADAPVTTLNGSMLTPSKILAESYDNGFKKIEVRRTRTEKIPLLTLDKGKWENVTRRAHGERMYRPISRTPADGSATVNRQLLVIMKKKQPTMKFMQHLPNMVEFTRITPPPPFSTMISPILRRRIKITQKKIPPRVINPQIQSVNPLTIQVNSSTDNRQKFTRHEFSWTTTLPSIILPREFIQSTTPTFVLPKPTYSSAHSKTLHSHRLPATHKPTTRPTQLDQIRHYSENTARTFYYSRVVVPTNSSPKPSPQPTMYKSTTTVRPSVKSAEVRPMIIDAGKKFPLTNPFIPSHSSTNLRVEAESIEYLKPIIENVTAESPISKEKIISLSSHSFDDYDDQMDTNDFESYMIADSEIPTVAAYPQTISTSPSLFTKSSTIPPTTQLTTQLNIPPTRPPTTPLLRAKNWTPIVFPLNHDESLTTEEVVGQDYSEAVEFEIQTGGEHL